MLLYATISVLSLIVPAIHAQTPTTLSQSQINAYKPYTYFAAAAFCDRQQLLNWACGSTCNLQDMMRSIFVITNTIAENCLANQQFRIESDAIGGDATTLPTWFVGYSKPRNEIVVSYMDIDEATMYVTHAHCHISDPFLPNQHLLILSIAKV